MRTFVFLMCLLVAGLNALCAQDAPAKKPDGNRLAYLDGPLDPYYPHRDFPKLITPQWVGEDGVECVVTLAIDDMRDSAKYETFLRPILNRLKKIDRRAPVSIMSCRVDPADPQLQKWLKEGLSIECHTYDHPCPLLQDGGLVKAKETYDKCVDLMNQIPSNKPVAFRVPCCDSKNTPSPRFWAEIFNKTTEKGNSLQIDSSVFNIITNKDKDLPKEITELPSGEERFRRYVPFENFVNTIEDYPYPYIIGGMCWEFPCVTPSDWSAQFVQKPNNPDTLRDWKLVLDACVLKQGTFNLVFHPHGWIQAEQIVELIDHAVTKHGKKVKFLTFKECAERLNRHLFVDHPIRKANGSFSGTVLIDSGDARDFKPDGFMDIEFEFDCPIDIRAWDSKSEFWMTSTRDPNPFGRFRLTHNSAFTSRWRDLDNDGQPEIVSGPSFKTMEEMKREEQRNGARFEDKVTISSGGRGSNPTFTLPGNLTQRDMIPPDALRLIDINSDGKLDLLFSNHERYCLYLFKDMKEGWATKVFDLIRGERTNDKKIPVIPPFVRADGTNNGAFFHSNCLWLQNEDTHRLPDHVFKLPFPDMLPK